MKNLLNSIGLFLVLTLLITSCAPSQDVITGNHIQKRKYTKGFYVNKKPKKSKVKSSLAFLDKKPADHRLKRMSSKAELAAEISPVEETDTKKSKLDEKQDQGVTKTRKTPAYFDNTIRDRVERRLGKSKDKIQKKLKKHSDRIAEFSSGENGPLRTDGNATAGFVFSIIGFIIAGLLFGTLAIIFGAIGLGKINRSGGNLKGRGLATAAIIIGIIDIIAVLVILSAL